MSKLNREKIRKRTAKPPREILHSMDCLYVDLIGPITVIEHGRRVDISARQKEIYTLVTMDAHSRYVKMSLLTTKGQAASELINIINYLETQSEKKLKRVHSDGGREFINQTTLNYFNEKGIEHTYTSPNTSEHNPVERMNRTLEEMSRCFLQSSNAPQELWGDSLQHSVTVHNHTAWGLLDGKTPYMIAFNKEGPNFNINKLKVFGCNAYLHVPDKDRGTMEPKAEHAIYIGHDENMQQYKLLLTSSLTVVSNRDVQFDEDKFTHLHNVISRLKSTTKEGPKKDWKVKPLKDNNDKSTSKRKWTVHDITDERIYKGNKEYKVYWKGEYHPSWEPEDVLLQDCPDVIAAYHKRSETLNFIQEEKVLLSVSNNKKVEKEMWDKGKGNLDYVEPTTYNEAIRHEDRDYWIAAMQKELNSLSKHGVALLSPLPISRQAIGCRWIFKAKRDKDNNIISYKARLVIQGFRQVEGIDFTDTYAPTVSPKSIKFLLALAADRDWEIKQLDFDTAFLNADLEEDIYMKIPQGYHELDNEWKKSLGYKSHSVLKLLKALYGLKQAPRAWNKQLDASLAILGYLPTMLDPCVYMKKYGDDVIYLTVYVDDMLAVFPKHLLSQWEQDKQKIASTYAIKDLGDCSFILNMIVTRDRVKRTLILSQKTYIEKILSNHKSMLTIGKTISTPFLFDDLTVCPTEWHEGDIILNEKDHSLYRTIVGELMYAAMITRIDIAYISAVLARYVNEPHNYHLAAARRVLQYLQGRDDFALVFAPSPSDNINDKIVIYSDSNWGGDRGDRHSVGGWVTLFNGSPLYWQSKKQSTRAMSSTEAELYALVEAAKEGMFIRQWMKLYLNMEHQITIRGDNQGALFMADHPTDHNRTKHIDIKNFNIRDWVHDESIKLEYVSTKVQLADILTKAVTTTIFKQMIATLMYIPSTHPDSKQLGLMNYYLPLSTWIEKRQAMGRERNKYQNSDHNIINKNENNNNNDIVSL